jgi:hypothetical protein
VAGALGAHADRDTAEVRRIGPGSLWYPTYSALLLGSYCFVYLVVFKVRFKELGSYEYVLFIFRRSDSLSRVQ